MRAPPLLALVVVAVGGIGGTSVAESPSRRAAVGHGLSIVVPAGWRVTHHRFTPCSDPVERFSLLGAGQVLTIEERLVPVRAELRPRTRQFTVRGKPTPIECCSIPGRRSWVVQFGDRGRAFYAYLYPGNGSARSLLHALDSFSVSAHHP